MPSLAARLAQVLVIAAAGTTGGPPPPPPAAGPLRWLTFFNAMNNNGSADAHSNMTNMTNDVSALRIMQHVSRVSVTWRRHRRV